MAAAAMLTNRKTAISPQRFNRSTQSLAGRILALRAVIYLTCWHRYNPL